MLFLFVCSTKCVFTSPTNTSNSMVLKFILCLLSLSTGKTETHAKPSFMPLPCCYLLSYAHAYVIDWPQYALLACAYNLAHCCYYKQKRPWAKQLNQALIYFFFQLKTVEKYFDSHHFLAWSLLHFLYNIYYICHIGKSLKMSHNSLETPNYLWGSLLLWRNIYIDRVRFPPSV